jgi:preprotein translocase subunit SecD
VLRALIFAWLLTFAGVAQDTRPARVAFHLLADCTAKNAYKISRVGTSSTLCLDPRAIADDTDIAGARIQKDGQGNPDVIVALTEKGAKAMLETTRQNIGNRMAVVVNGGVIDVFTIRAPVSRVFHLNGHFAQQEMDDLVGALNGRTGNR